MKKTASSGSTIPIPILVIVGPTASGKSDLAVDLAKRFNGEVISADSRQVYKGLDIGTGKITRREMKGVPHHLLDVTDPRIPSNSPRHYNVEKWCMAAEQTINEIHTRGKLPVVCGGTGFYISALVDGIKFPDVPPNIRLREQLAQKSAPELFKKLQKLDPRRARDMQANGDFKNSRRLIRAIEIASALGKIPKIPTSPAKLAGQHSKKYDPLFIGLSVPPEKLKTRIAARLQKRFKKGMIAEVQKLHKNGLRWKRMRELGLEYGFIADHLEFKKESLDEMREKLAVATWHYAKRQMTWWKRDKRIVWINAKKPTAEAKLLIIERFNGLK